MSTSIMVQAKKRGTLTSATGNYHFDPDGFPAARKRLVPAAVAAEAQAKGLVKILRTRVITEDEGDTSVDGRAAERASAHRGRLDERTGAMADMLGASGVGDTFATTHTEQDRTITANIGGGHIVEEIDDGDGSDEHDEAGDDHDDDGIEHTSDAGDAPPASDDAADGEGLNSGSSRVRRAAARKAAAGGQGAA
jgi:hypothetical protein